MSRPKWTEDGDELLEELRRDLEKLHEVNRAALALALIEERAGQWVL